MVTNELMEKREISEQADRVRAHSPEQVNRQVDADAQRCVHELAGKSREEITSHLNELSREWDMERYLQTNASLLALSGVVLGATVNKKFLVLPGVVFGFLFQHALQGWCPPMPVFRQMGVRTRKEINRETYALKALRGDFDGVNEGTKRGQDNLEPRDR